MKTIVKLITVNDGKCEDFHNGDFLSVIDYPRTEAIISAFLDDGYVLESRTQRITPSVQEEGAYSFYIGGWDLLFTKTVEDDAEDDSDEFLKKVIEEAVHSN